MSSRPESVGDKAHPSVQTAEFDTRLRMFITLLASMVTIVISSPEGQAVLFAASLAYALSIRRYRALHPAAHRPTASQTNRPRFV